MSVIAYNGVALGFVRTKSFAQEAVFLGPDVPKYRYTATVEVVIHRLTAGTDRGNLPPANPGGVAPAGPDGLAAWAAVHDRLMARRRPFVWRMATGVVANVPAGGFGPAGNGDVEWGPVPLKLTILGFNSLGSAVAEYTIQWTAPNPCPNRNGVQAVLGHVWKSDDDLDQHLFMTRTYTGVLHLDPRVVGAQSGVGGVHPDAIRPLILPPRTPGMHRVQVQARFLEDGYTLAYKVVDRQPTAFVNSRDVVRMEADHKVEHQSPGVASRAKGVIARAQPYIDAVTVGGEIGSGLAGLFAAKVAARLAGVIKADVSLLKIVAGVYAKLEASLEAAQYVGIPTVTHTITATAYGHPSSPYATLASASRAVCLFRLMRSGAAIDGISLFDGSYSQHDRSDPKAVAGVLQVTTRPRSGVFAPVAEGTWGEDILRWAGLPRPAEPLRNDGGVAWARGGNRMPTLVGGRVQPLEITAGGPKNAPVPDGLRQLVYGGSIVDDATGLWGWVDAAFAPDLMSTRDAASRLPQDAAYTRADGPAASRGVDATLPPAVPLAATLIAALQDPCAYKQAARFNVTATPPVLP